MRPIRGWYDGGWTGTRLDGLIEGVEIVRILITAGAGLIGSQTADAPLAREPEARLLDSLPQPVHLVDMARSVGGGDSATDVSAGLAAGVCTRLLVGGARDEAATHAGAALTQVLPTLRALRD